MQFFYFFIFIFLWQKITKILQKNQGQPTVSLNFKGKIWLSLLKNIMIPSKVVENLIAL